MSRKTVGVKLQSSGWCGSKSRSSGGWNGPPNALGGPAPAASARAFSAAKNAPAGAVGAAPRRKRPRLLGGEERLGVVGVEGVAVGMGQQDVRRELADLGGD